MNNEAQDKNRIKIYDVIRFYPGITASRIVEFLKIKPIEVSEQLQTLIQERIVRVSKTAGYEQYYIDRNRVKKRDREIQSIRRRIFTLIEQNPGLHLSKIAQMLDISIPLADYHLIHLERDGKIFAQKDEKKYIKSYYTTDSGITKQEQKILEVFRKKIPLKIVLLLLKYEMMRHKEMVGHLGIVSSTLSYHLSGLRDSGVIAMRIENNIERYYLTDRNEIIRILKKHKSHIAIHYILESYKDIWQDLHY